MKYIKTFEDKKEGHEKLDKHIADGIMKTIHSKDMDNWSVAKLGEPKKTGVKNLDTNLGQKVKDLFEEYGMSVSVGPGDFCTKWGLFPDEEQFDEYRVNIDIIQTEEEWLDNYNYYKSKEEAMKDQGWTEEEYYAEYEKDKIHGPNNGMRDELQFSVFLPHKRSGDRILEALADASDYLKMLHNSIDKMLDGNSTIEDPFKEYTEGFKKLLKLKKVNINNDNIEIIPTISYRLYKDTKFISALGDELGVLTLQNFFNDWLKLL